ncbi:MAG: L,D-transpeptidase family protein [Clostridium sp.]
MDKLEKNNFISKYKKPIVFSVAIILVIGFGMFGFYKYNENNTLNKKIEGMDLFKSGDYEKASEVLNEYLVSVSEDEEVKEILEIISIYNTSKGYFENGDFELTISTLETMPSGANNYSIKDKIEELINSANEGIKKKEIESEIVKLKESIASEDYDLAKEIIGKLEAMNLTHEAYITELNSNKKIVDDYYAEKAKKEEELASSKEQAKPESKPQVGNQGTSKQPYIAYTSPASNSSQLITITSKGGSNGELVMWEKDSAGNWSEVDRMFARLGEGGMKVSNEVYEKDMCTPTGVYTLTESFGVAKNPGSGVPYRLLDGSEYWVDDPNSPFYNTMQFGEPNGRWESAEHLTDYQNAYKYSLVVDYNRSPVIPGKSSAIFLHVDVGIPTWGCPAVAENKMIKILNWIKPSSNPKVILGFTENYISNF